jgi:hypothetical protein
MISSDQSLGIFKVGSYLWMKRLHDLGEISFSNACNFVAQARATGNNEQGDTHEAVFARLLPNDSRINEMKDLLGKDLEIAPDGKYMLLRRRSSKFVPLYCLYTLRDTDFTDQLKHEGLNTVEHEIPQEIYAGFTAAFTNSNVMSTDMLPAIVFFQSDPFFKSIDNTLLSNGYTFSRKAIEYSKMAPDEFFISPTDKREELFSKRPRYKYQREVRYIITNKMMHHLSERLNITSPVYSPKDKHLFLNVPIGIKLDVIAQKR